MHLTDWLVLANDRMFVFWVLACFLFFARFELTLTAFVVL